MTHRKSTLENPRITPTLKLIQTYSLADNDLRCFRKLGLRSDDITFYTIYVTCGDIVPVSITV